ncbi:MAG TPA: 2-C-methyl-D-erythritol 4-phosphate cytidylyltransferase [Actinomycetota bacterium]|nr:2-C-methyl-D-erythritol 4-phosphate cytidylyltransferase [Actinomycetota bacterium]
MEGAVAIVLAAGRGDRLGGETPKAFASLGGRPLLAHAASTASSARGVAYLVVAAPAGWEDLARAVVEPMAPHVVVRGGESRQASVRSALAAVPEGASTILCHDAARALAPVELFEAVLEALAGWDGVVPVLPVADTVKRVRGEVVERTEERAGLALAQTPQAFGAEALRDAHARAARDGLEVTDDAAVLEAAGYRVRAVAGDPRASKITTAEDLARAEAVVAELARG